MTRWNDERHHKCPFCHREMFYSGHPNHEPEVTIEYGEQTHNLGYRTYAHLECAKKVFTFGGQYPHDAPLPTFGEEK